MNIIKDYGNARIRELVDGTFVAEIKTGWWIWTEWKAISRNAGILWDKNNCHYCNVVTIDAAKKLLAGWGF